MKTFNVYFEDSTWHKFKITVTARNESDAEEQAKIKLKSYLLNPERYFVVRITETSDNAILASGIII